MASLPRLGCDVMRAGTACCCSPAQLMSVCPLGTKPLCPLPLRCLPSKRRAQVWRADESRTFGFRIHNAIVASLPKRHAACDQTRARAHTRAPRRSVRRLALTSIGAASWHDSELTFCSGTRPHVIRQLVKEEIDFVCDYLRGAAVTYFMSVRFEGRARPIVPARAYSPVGFEACIVSRTGCGTSALTGC